MYTYKRLICGRIVRENLCSCQLNCFGSFREDCRRKKGEKEGGREGGREERRERGKENSKRVRGRE